MEVNHNKITNIMRVLHVALQDALTLLLLGSFGLLFMEATLPGFISGRISFAIIGIGIAILFFANILVAKKIHSSYQLNEKKHLPFVPFLTVLLFLFAGNALLKLPLWQNLAISVVLTAAFSLILDSSILNGRKK